MNVVIQPAIEQVPGLQTAIDRATRFLEEEVGPTGALWLRAEWGVSRGAEDRLRVAPTLRGWGSESTEHFTPEELADVRLTERRLHRFVGDMLRTSSAVLMRQVWQNHQESEGA